MAEDFEPYAQFMAHEDTRFIGGPQVRSVAWRSFISVAGAWVIQGHSMFTVIEKSTGRWVGRLGPWVPEGWPGQEVGWALSPETWGKGYATEGAAAAMDWVFEHRGWTDCIHSIHPDNVASQKVAQRLGSTNRGPGKMPAPFEDSPIDIWGQTREEWRARRR